jgi:hypothetical protein
VSPQGQTCEVVSLVPDEMRTVGLYGVGMGVQSELLPGLELRVDDMFV